MNPLKKKSSSHYRQDPENAARSENSSWRSWESCTWFTGALGVQPSSAANQRKPSWGEPSLQRKAQESKRQSCRASCAHQNSSRVRSHHPMYLPVQPHKCASESTEQHQRWEGAQDTPTPRTQCYPHMDCGDCCTGCECSLYCPNERF